MSGKKLDYLGVSAFCESMAMMVQAGIHTDEAIGLLQSDHSHTGGVLEQGLAAMKTKVDEGAGLAAAMKESGIFPEYALQMVEDGADIIDVGAESSRPGFVTMPAEEEMERLRPYLELLMKELPVPVSVDKFKSKTADMAAQYDWSRTSPHDKPHKTHH